MKILKRRPWMEHNKDVLGLCENKMNFGLKNKTRIKATGSGYVKELSYV